jgi:hypothetical protein
VVLSEVVVVVVVGLVVAVAVAVAVSATAIATVVVAALQDLEWSCVDAYDPAGTGHLRVVFDAVKPVSENLTNVKLMTTRLTTYLLARRGATLLPDTLLLQG